MLLPLYEQDGLWMGELAQRARLSKQSMTELVRRLKRATTWSSAGPTRAMPGRR